MKILTFIGATILASILFSVSLFAQNHNSVDSIMKVAISEVNKEAKGQIILGGRVNGVIILIGQCFMILP